LIAQLAMHGQTSVNKIYDPAAGSGSLLLQAAYFGESDRSFRFYPITFSSSFSSLPVLP